MEDDIRDQMNKPEHYNDVYFLEKLCLDFIVKNFEHFYFAFTASQDKKIQRNFEFLQRRFSDQLAVGLHNKKNLNDKYFGFLINPYLHILKDKWFNSSDYLNSVDVFRRLPNLRRIHLTNGNDNILKNVAQFCPKIETIHVFDSINITDTGVKYMCEIKNGTVPCPEIKVIKLEFTSITENGVECLIQRLPSLEGIHYPNVPLLLYSIYKKILTNCQKMQIYNLLDLKLAPFENLTNYTEVLEACLLLCPKLERFDCFITQREQLNFFTNTHLKDLSLYAWKMDPKINIDSLIKRNGSNLTILNVEDCSISISVLAKHCPVLKQFQVDNVNLIGENYNVQVLFPCLHNCFISHLRPADARGLCLLLSSSPKLKSISFDDCILTLEMKNQILKWCKNPSAKEINFYFDVLEMIFIRDILLSSSSLKKMCLSICVNDDETKKMLHILSENLPNKPYIVFAKRFEVSMDYFDSYSHYLNINPGEKYKSSTIYDSLFRQITVK